MSSFQANSGSFFFLDSFVVRSLLWFILLYVIAFPLFITRISLSLRYRLFCRLNVLDDLYSWLTGVDWVCECVIALWNFNGRLRVRAILEEKDSALSSQWIKYNGGIIFIDRWIVKCLRFGRVAGIHWTFLFTWGDFTLRFITTYFLWPLFSNGRAF
jgi:hypothetical protein